MTKNTQNTHNKKNNTNLEIFFKKKTERIININNNDIKWNRNKIDNGNNSKQLSYNICHMNNMMYNFKMEKRNHHVRKMISIQILKK
eukprot:UN04309